MRPHSIFARLTLIMLTATQISCGAPEQILVPLSPGNVRITVSDRFGGALSGATVELLQGASTLEARTTGNDGTTIFSSVDVGSYNIRASKNGFVGATVAAAVVSSLTSSASVRLDPAALPSGGSAGTRVISGLGTPVRTFETDVFVVDQNSHPINGLPTSAFSVGSFNASTGATLNFNLLNAQTISQPNKGPYSAALLLDQSGSIAGTDPNDSRLQAAKIFLSAVGSGDNVVLSAFAGSGRAISFETTTYGSFTTNGTSYFGTLDQLAGQIGGGTPLYKSTSAMVDYVARNATNANRAVVVFTDGADTDGGVTPAQLYSQARNARVAIFTVALSNSVDVPTLQDMANQTGGVMMLATDARQLLSMYGTLGNLLHGVPALYRLRWTSTRTAGNWNTGFFSTSVRVVTPSGTVFVPFAVNY